jgi:hypothetical protein
MPSDAKQNIFVSCKKGGIGIRSFVREYIGALLRDVEVYISDTKNLTSHAILSSIEAATKQCTWNLLQDGKIPCGTCAAYRANNISISGKKTLFFLNDADNPLYEKISFDHTHIVEKAVCSASLLGFMLRDLNCELGSRFVDELLLKDRNVKALANPLITTRASMGAHIGEGNSHFPKYSLSWVT